MPPYTEILKRAKEVWKQIGLNQKITIASMILALLVSVVFLGNWAKKPDFSLLYSRLNNEDAGKIVELLKEAEIPFTLKNNGTAVYVPSKNVYEMRLKMAQKGVPQGGGVGFEIFDKTNIGMTDFVQKLNYLRALEGELTRTIMQMEGVETVRVHIVMPEEKLFTENQEKPSASVVLGLSTPGLMDMGQIAGIKNLIAGAVEGLNPNSITIVDTKGNLLSKAMGGEDITSELTSVQLGQKKSVEHYLTEKVQTLLEGVLGKNNAIVRIDAALNFDKQERTEEIYDPEKAVVRSETITSEKSSGFSGPPRGVVGVDSNIKEAVTVDASESKESKKSKEIVKNTYEIDKTTKHIIETVGDVDKLSAAVFIKKKMQADAEGKMQMTVRPEEELQGYIEIVKNAIGFNEKRGDTVVVKEVEFDTTALQEMESSLEKAHRKRLVETIIRHIITGLIIIVFPVLFLVMLNLVRKPPKAEVSVAVEEAADTPEDKQKKERVKKEHAMEDKIFNVADQHPEEIAQIVASWLREEK